MNEGKELKVVADVYSPSKEEYKEMTVGEPTNMLETRAMANFLARSKFLPVALRGDLNTAVMLIITCKQYGLPITALSEVMEVNGRLSFWGRTKLAIVLKSPVCEYILPKEQSDKSCTIVAKRKGYPSEMEEKYTIDMAEKAGLLGRSDAWKKHPADMLYWRAVSRVISKLFPDVIQGFATVEEEEESDLHQTLEAPKEIAKPRAKKVKAVVVEAEPIVKAEVEPVPADIPAEAENPVESEISEPKEVAIAPEETKRQFFRFVKRVLLLGGKRTLVAVNPLTEEEDQWLIGTAETASELKKRTGMKVSFVPEVDNSIIDFKDEQ